MIENYLSKWARRIALAVVLVGGMWALVNTQTEGEPAQWVSQVVGCLPSSGLALLILMLPGMILGYSLGFVYDFTMGIGVFRPEGERVYIEIIGVPSGEAPDWVREAWVGTILPLAPGREEPQSVATSGVVTRSPKSTLPQTLEETWSRSGSLHANYAVLIDEAIETLEKRSPQAADWWRINIPHLLECGRSLAFEASVCRKIEPTDPI